MSFEEMVYWVEEFSKKLNGIKCCAVLCQSEMAAGMVLLSCFKAKVTALPLSLRYGELHCNKILDSIKPDAVITEQDGEFEILRITDTHYVEPKVHPALIMCTSGTTGTPKGAMLTESNIVTNVSDIVEYFDIHSKDTILIARPLYHAAVLTGEFLTALVKGVKIHFYSGNFNPKNILGLFEEHNITVFCGTPTILSMLIRLKKERNLESIKSICVSGECMGSEAGNQIVKAFPFADIYHIYGLTEASPRVSYLPPKLFAKHPDCVGIPLKSVQFKIVTSQGEIAAANEIGVLWVKGDNVMAGYYNDPVNTAKVINSGWLFTGDLALINEEGLLKIKGRSDDLIIRAGMNIYPQEIESALKLDSRVHEVFVRGVTDEKYGTQIVLNIVGDFSNIAEVKELCQISLPSYQVPTIINLLDKIEKSGSGKIIRR